jgi:hypothetical protein
MANKKRNVVFSKPDEPDFLKRIKSDIGYKEGDTVETKVHHFLLNDRKLFFF